MLFSDMTQIPAAPHVHFAVAIANSADLTHWSNPKIIATNAASPDIVREPSGQFIVTYQTPHGLAYRISANASLASWSRPHPLGPGLASRMIDAALAFTGHGVILGFKAGTTSQHFEIAWAPSLSGTFHLVGRPDIVVYNDTIENYEFLSVAGTWTLIATSNTLTSLSSSPWRPATPPWRRPGCTGAPGGRVTHPLPILQYRNRHLEHRLRTRQLGVFVRRPRRRGLSHLRRQHRTLRVRRLGSRPHRPGPEHRPDQLDGPTRVNERIRATR